MVFTTRTHKHANYQRFKLHTFGTKLIDNSCPVCKYNQAEQILKYGEFNTG